MSMKHLKDYYQQVEELYFDLASSLSEMEEDFKKGECTEEELQNLLIPVNNIKENYQRLSYVLFLLYQPNKDNKKKKYEKQNKELVEYFSKKGITVKQEIENESISLEKFKKELKEKFKHE